MQEEPLWPNLNKSLEKNLTSSVFLLESDELIIRSKDGLRFFKYNQKANDWQQISNCDTRFSDKNKFNQPRHKLKFFKINDKTYVSFLTIKNGYVFLELDKKNFKFKHVASDRKFIRKYDKLEFGYFYGPQNPLGLFSYNHKNGALFHFVNLTTPKTPIIRHEKTNIKLKENLEWKFSDANFYFTDVNGNETTSLVVQHHKGLSVYELRVFNDYFKPIKLFDVPVMAKKEKKNQNEKFYFARVTPVENKKLFFDLITIESDGLRVYKWYNDTNEYRLINFSDEFSEENNWNLKYSNSILFSDFDSSGVQKLVYSGPKGLRIDKLEKYDSYWIWNQMINFEFNENFNEKYLVPIEIIPLSKSPIKKPILISNDFINKKTVFIPFEEQNFNEENDESEIPKSISKAEKIISKNYPLIQSEEIKTKKSILPLSNMFDMKSIMNSCINPSNGQLILNLPLIKLPVLDEAILSLNYISTFVPLNNSCVGLGWSLSQEFIFADFKSNKFAHQFYLITKSSTTTLLHMNKIENDEILFKIENDKEQNLIIKYNIKKCQWIVENENEKIKKLYGGGISSERPNGNGVEWKNNWFRNKEFSDKPNHPFKWCLTNLTTESDRVDFEYNDKKTTSITKIKSDKNDTIIEFNYDQNHILTSYNYKTKNHIQNIEFNYEMSNNDHLLKSIIQKDNHEKVLEFVYEQISNSMKISKIIFPDRNDSLNFTYEDASQKAIENNFSYLLNSDLASHEDKETKAQLSSSIDYSILSYTTKSRSKLILTILTQEGTKFGVEIKASETYKNGHFSNYKILSFPKHFVVYLLDSKSNEDFVYLCKIQSLRKEYENSKIEVDISDKLKLVNCIKSVSFGSEFIAIINLNDEFSIIELVENEWIVNFSECLSSSKALMSMNEDQNLLIYNDTNLNCLFKDQNSKWQSKLVACKPGMLTALDISIECFDISETKLDGIKQFFKKNFLHFSKNIILLNQLLVKNDTMSSELLVLLTDDEFNIINEQTLENKTLSLSDSIDFELKFSDEEVIDAKIYHFKQGEKYVVGFKKQEKTFDFKNGNKIYKRTYKLENQDILTTIVDHHGYNVEIKDNKKSVKDDFKDAFLIDIESFYASLTTNRISCKEKLFDLNSESWTVTKIEDDKKEIIKIGDKFQLFKDSTSWQLYSNNKLEFDFKTDSLDNIQVSYPYYIAYMSDSDKSVKILPFENDKIGKEVFITKADYVLPGGNAYLFGIKESGSYSIKFFTIPTQSIFHVRIIEKAIILDKQKYRKTYEYDDKSSSLQNGVVLYSKFKSIPAGDSSKHGYIQYDLSTEIKYFNSDGKLVKIDKETTDIEEDEIESDQKNLDKKPSVLYAKDGKSEIVDFYNLDIKSDEADYIGFEVYEKLNNWVYDQSSCVRNEWPLIGNSFLRLKKSSISKEFKPGKFIFECSCWVRIPNGNSYEIGKEFEDFFLLIVETGEKLSSKITSIHQDWLFLAVHIDVQNRKADSIKCVITSEKYEQIDVDHIKWIRKNGRFQISTYDESCSLLISQLDETNTIKKIFYYDSYQPIALIDSNNQLIQTSFTYNQNKTMLQLEALNAFYETFSDYELNRNWLIDEPDDWLRNQKFLIHKNISKKSSIRLRQPNINLKSLAMYFNIELSSISSELSLEINFHEIKFKQREIFVNDVKIENLADGFYFVIFEAKRVILWKEKKLLIDRKFNNLSESREVLFSSYGLTKLSNLIVFNDPLIKVNHYNSIGQLTQSVQLIDDSSVIIKQDIYDECMRESIETKPSQFILKDNEQSLVYRDDFVTNYFFDLPTNVWSTKKLLGKISDLNPFDKGFSYRRKIYSKDPLNYIESIDFPDKLLSNKEAFVCSNKSYEYFESLFPVESGFVNKTSIELNGNRTIKVYDKNNNMVALFNHTLGFKDILTTYEFDRKNNLVKILPPLFHANVFTLDNFGLTYEEINSKWNSDEYYQNLQKQFGSFYVYDDKTSSLIESCTPEQGKQIYVYNKFGFLRFNLKYDSNERPFILEYSNYNNKGEVCEKGFTKNEKFFDIKFLKSIADINDLSDTHCMQESISTVSIKPGFNGKQVFSYVKNASNNFEYNDKVCYSDKDKMLKKVVNLKRMDGSSCLLRMKREYSGDRLNSIVYPFSYQDKIMKLNYVYNKQGLVSSISIDDKQIASFDYTPSGNLNQEALLTNLDLSFTRNYSYNSSDLLTSQDDCFIKESLSYSENGYECENKQFDTSISKTMFYPKWYEKCDIRSLCLNEDILIQKLENLNRDEANYLLNNLVELGVLNEEFKVLRNLTLSEGLVKLPIKYDEHSIKKLMSLLNENFPLNPYGHQYSYGSHLELVNSKYFIGEENFKPINNKSFVMDNKNNLGKSELIWNVLIKIGFIIPQINEDNSKFGKVKNNEWIDTKSLEILLKSSNYTSSLTKKLIVLLVDFFSKRQTLTKDLFCSIYTKWFQFDDQFKQIELEINLELGAKLWDILATNDYLYESDIKKCALFKNEFYLVISENGLLNTLPEIIGILVKYNDNQIGSSSCDVRSYNTDANGNHKLFHVGFDRLQFNYKSNSNQISSIENEGQTYKFEYDSLGNVTTAEHKGIVKIIYDEISNRPVRFILKNGQIVDLGYDSMNERVYKCVLDKNDKKVKEILYFRDNTGRCLVEKEIFYDQNEQFKDEYYTAYVYGPKGLIGYIRNDEFYNVITDHEQSVRLVVKNMEVIAAYDYLPYGQLIRNFGTKSSQLRYRFTGQEWDEELGLYNYHARLYDPTIGRFYQVDEKEQYASPYKYAGNSPVSMYDPDGNLAFIVVIGFVAVGAYLGGAAAMDDWAFWNWEWDNWNLYMGMFFGGLTGFFLPFGFVAASTVIGGIGAFIGIGMVGSMAITALLGILGAYFAMSSSMGTFNPCKWKWIKPGLWNAAFQGFSSAVQLPNAFSNFAAIYKKSFSKFLTYLALGSVTAAGMAYLNAASINNSYNPTKWKMNQRTTIGMINGAISGFFLPITISNIYGFYSKAFPEITKNLVEKLGKLGYWLAYGSLSLIVITPVIFLFALKQGMNCSWSDLIKTPAFLETLISGLLVGLSMPNILLKAIPNTMKIYREGILEFYDRTINAKLIENDQKLAKVIADEVNEKCAKKLSDNVKNSEAYKNASEETKQLVDKYLDNCRQDLMTTGKLRPIKEFLNDLLKILDEKNPQNGLVNTKNELKTIVENMDLDQQKKDVYFKLIDEVSSQWNSAGSDPKGLGGNGVYSVVRLKDGRSIVCHSGSKEIYAMFNADGSRVSVDEMNRIFPPNTNLAAQVPVEKMDYADQVSTDTNRTKPHASNCGEFRSIYIVANLNDIPTDQILSISAFKSENANLEPVLRCKNCQVTTNMVKEPLAFTDSKINRETPNQIDRGYTRLNDGSIVLYDIETRNVNAIYDANANRIYGPNVQNVEFFSSNLQPKYTSSGTIYEIFNSKSYLNAFYIQEIRYDLSFTNSNVNWIRFQDTKTNSKWTLAHLYRKLTKNKKD
ncbi:unnamed protein product [Brachionus calyciflorus]|uniref:Uncharacterized protein n=1 Tax=Brachionus calyciflorus TaxID=104777 RepID=A0A813M5T1_9BILA|nr:unnamed protein product [Brachionus calyciflorus]